MFSRSAQERLDGRRIGFLGFTGLLGISVIAAGLVFGVPSALDRLPAKSLATPHLALEAAPPAAVVEASDGTGALVVIDSAGNAGISVSGIAPWDAESSGNIDAAIAALPGRLLGQLGNRSLGPLSITVSETGRTLSGFQPYGTAANFFSTLEGRNEVVLYPGQRPQTVLHELGHAFNFRNLPAGDYAQVYLEPEMRSFMASTGWAVLTPDAELARLRDQALVATQRNSGQVWTRLSADDPIEDFANSFAMYFADPAGLARLSPARFEWFVANIGQ